MALTNIQDRIEKSIFEAIRKILVREGHIPDISNTVRYPVVSSELTDVAQTNWETDLKTIQTSMEFAAEVFGHSSSQSKGIKKTPRIAIIPRRIMPGDIGLNATSIYKDPLSPDNYLLGNNPAEASNLHLDIHLVSSTAKEERFLNAVLFAAIGIKKYIDFYDVANENFFIKQFNYYDLPDPQEGIEEKVYSYEVSDIYMFDGSPSTPVSLIKEITVDVTLTQLQVILAEHQTIIGPYVNDGNLFIDLSGTKYN